MGKDVRDVSMESWRRGLLPGERHGFWVNPGWYDARRLRAEDDHDDVPRLRAALVRALPPLPADGAVLDLGAGTGDLVLLLAQYYPRIRYALLDGNAAALDRAADKLAAAHPNLKAIFLPKLVEPANDAPLPGGPYHLVTSSAALHDIAPPAAPDDAAGRVRHHQAHVSLLRRVSASLVPGGHFIYADAMRPRFRVAEHLAALSDAGFEEVDCSYVVGRMLVCGGQRGIGEG